MRRSALAICARSDAQYGDAYVLREGLEAQHRPCFKCGVDLLASPTTTAMEGTMDVQYACNPCGKASVAERGVRKLAIAPGALPGTTPDERRRRNELEAHGFEDYKP